MKLFVDVSAIYSIQLQKRIIENTFVILKKNVRGMIVILKPKWLQTSVFRLVWTEYSDIGKISMI